MIHYSISKGGCVVNAVRVNRRVSVRSKYVEYNLTVSTLLDIILLTDTKHDQDWIISGAYLKKNVA